MSGRLTVVWSFFLARWPLAAWPDPKWSPSCKSEVTLSAAFAGLNLPADEGRVCESDDKKTRLESRGDDKEKWTSLARARGDERPASRRSRAPSYCIYTKGAQRLARSSWGTYRNHLGQPRGLYLTFQP